VTYTAKSLDALAAERLRDLGFRRKVTLVKEIRPGVEGRVGLNTGHEPGGLRLLTLVGLHHRGIEEELAGYFGYDRRHSVTAIAGLFDLFPDPPHWLVMVEDADSAEAAVATIRDGLIRFGLPWMESTAEPENLVAWLGQQDVGEPWLPLVLAQRDVGRPDLALATLDQYAEMARSDSPSGDRVRRLDAGVRAQLESMVRGSR
jgi:hypothetical protein